jgi:SAM-dependent methyltransferase
MSYGPEFAEIYDLVHTRRGKDYQAESQQVADAIRARCPKASSVLDAGCGTGGHLAHLAGVFDEVEGLEVAPAMLDVARAKLPGVVLHQADMRTFDLGRRYDAIICMFASIAHQRSAAELEATLERFAGHLEPDGVVVFDPWWFPEEFVDGSVAGDVGTADGQTLGQMSHSRRDGDRSRTEVHYLVASAEAGTRHVSEVFWHSLFPHALYEKALVAAGFEFEYVDSVMDGRGMFVGTLTNAKNVRTWT